jgi:copper chaperone NosL
MTEQKISVRPLVDRFEQFLNEPIRFWGRIVLALLVIPLALSFTQPLWRISLQAPQYPAGLHMDVYAYTLDGGHNGHDIEEINELNHYIGMHRIERSSFADLDWLPFALGLVGLLTLRAAVIGNVRNLIDLVVITSYITVFAFVRFVYKLYVFGHDLDPHAAVTIQPFMPVVVGTKQVANFTTHSWPHIGTAFMATFATGLVVVMMWHLWVGYREAWRQPRAARNERRKATDGGEPLTQAMLTEVQ